MSQQVITTIKRILDDSKEFDDPHHVAGYEVNMETCEGTFKVKVDLSECSYRPIAADLLGLLQKHVEQES